MRAQRGNDKAATCATLRSALTLRVSPSGKSQPLSLPRRARISGAAAQLLLAQSMLHEQLLRGAASNSLHSSLAASASGASCNMLCGSAQTSYALRRCAPTHNEVRASMRLRRKANWPTGLRRPHACARTSRTRTHSRRKLAARPYAIRKFATLTPRIAQSSQLRPSSGA